MGKKKLKLHIGCGGIYKKGYVNIDAFNSSAADVRAKANKLPYPKKSVDTIENYHLLEHLDRKECYTALKEWFRVLKPGGRLKIEVPDLEKNIKIFLNSNYHERWKNYREEFKHGRIQTIYGKGGQEGQLHKNGFDKERLKKILKKHGFVKVRVSAKKGTPIKRENLIAICEKPKKHISQRIKYGEIRNQQPQSISIARKNLPRRLLRKIKGWCVYCLRYLADTIEKIKFPNF